MSKSKKRGVLFSEKKRILSSKLGSGSMCFTDRKRFREASGERFLHSHRGGET
jgi:hypothetical protein